MNKNLILVHMTKPEINAYSKFQGGSNLDPEMGIPNFEKLGNMLLQNSETMETFKKLILQHAMLPPKQSNELDDAVEKEFGKKTKATEEQKKHLLIKKIADKGTEGEKQLALVPKSVIRFILKIRPLKKNSKTGLFELCKAGAGIVGLFSGIFGSRSHRSAANHHDEMAAIAREQARKEEELRQSLGYYDPWENKAMHTRIGYNPDIGAVVKEYYDPRTGKAISYEEAKKVKEEMENEQPHTKNSYLEYVLSPAQQKAIKINKIKSQKGISPEFARKLGRGDINILEALRLSDEDQEKQIQRLEQRGLEQPEQLSIENNSKPSETNASQNKSNYSRFSVSNAVSSLNKDPLKFLEKEKDDEIEDRGEKSLLDLLIKSRTNRPSLGKKLEKLKKLKQAYSFKKGGRVSSSDTINPLDIMKKMMTDPLGMFDGSKKGVLIQSPPVITVDIYGKRKAVKDLLNKMAKKKSLKQTML